jgi:glycosyltransferase involved in cell wall biosynthesis
MFDFLIIIPAYNEEKFIAKTLDSLVQQSYTASQIIVVNDGSTDKTASIVQSFADDYEFIQMINKNSKSESIPGTKVINAFYEGLKHADQHYDVICKFDADLVFPVNYIKKLNDWFSFDATLGMLGGVCTIQENEKWKIETLTNLDHLRGALKAYRKDCFEQIGGLKKAMGWDTLDELLARYHGWKVQVDSQLRVQHLKPTATTYNQKLPLQFGKSVYQMRYRLLISLLAIGKLSFKKKSISFLLIACYGYIKAALQHEKPLVSKDEGKFIRQYRMQSIRKNLKIN